MPEVQYYRAEPFGFGRPDAQGMVGESYAAWKLREKLAATRAASGR
jgi:hypothetical protein